MKSIGSTWIVITWQHDGEVVRFKVLITGGGDTRVIDVPGTKRMLNVTGLKPETNYMFSITSEDVNGQDSPVRETLMATTAASGKCVFRNIYSGPFLYINFTT